MKKRMYLFLLVMMMLHSCQADYYTTASGMQYLLEIEGILAEPFLPYYHSRMNKLDQLEDFLNGIEFAEETETTSKKAFPPYNNNEEFVGNPINSWVLINRFVNTWYKFGERFSHNKQDTERYMNLTDMANNLSGFNSLHELRGTAFGIAKVQETYLIPVDQFYNGLHKLQQKMTSMDVFEIGQHVLHLSYFKLAKEWLEYALQLFTKEYSYYEAKLPELFEYLAWASYQIGDLESAIDYTQKHIDLMPTSQLANHNLWHYKRLLFDSELDPSIRKKPEQHIKPWMKRNDGMCRREEKIPAYIAKHLFCQFYTPHPQFYLKPLKLEVAYNDPRILVFHEFLFEYELNLIKEAARNRLNVARVYSLEDGREITAGYRISKNAWLEEKQFYFISKIRNRAAAATGLNMNYAETLQVASYGIGGNYEPHWDHATPPNNASIFGYFGTMGNRIATLLMYLTEVEKGGDTVFTETGEGVMTYAIKGSTVFWYNLHRNGTGDERTRHGGCPILLGEKWVANLWVHEHGQEFRRPCSINRYE